MDVKVARTTRLSQQGHKYAAAAVSTPLDDHKVACKTSLPLMVLSTARQCVLQVLLTAQHGATATRVG